MPTEQIVALLVAERDRLNQAIEALQGPRRRGRPPRDMNAASSQAGGQAPRRRRVFDAAQRKAQSERMKAYWAAKRKESAKGKSK